MMKKPYILAVLRLITCLLLLLVSSLSLLQAEDAVEKILDLTSAAPSGPDASVQASTDSAAPGMVVTIKPGNDGYPGVKVTPMGFPVWDLSAFGHIQGKFTNLGDKDLMIGLRVDNPDDWKLSPWNTEQATIKPGESKVIMVIFGYTYGQKPGYAVRPAEINNILVMTTKSTVERKFRIDYLKASGPAGQKPAEDPRAIRIKPVNGVVVTAKTVLEAKSGGSAALTADGKMVEAKVTGKGPGVVLRPEAGRWDFREANQVRVKVKNTGTQPFTPSLRIVSQGGPTDKVTSARPISPGASEELVVSFIPAVPWQGINDPRQETKQEASNNKWNATKPNTGTKFTSDTVSGVELTVADNDPASAFTIESVIADAPPAVLPDWVGKRPPVDGDWTQTFSDEFSGNEIDLSKWNIYASNYWDKKTYFTKDNVIVSGGTVKLRYEKKTGKHNDSPTGKELNYASGFLDSYGKWTQRYGYFEARMKLPNAPGLWPAFWTMPDRGLAAGEQWRRASIENGGMEFDIVEQLTRWGTYRFNQAFHWDGYGKSHQALGTSNLYYQTDKDGFLTAGLLWTPGVAVYYINGKEVGRWETPRICTIESYPIFYMVSGGWDNNSLDDKMLPVDFEIDYIRVWQRKDLASAVDGVKSTQRTPSAPTTPDPKP